MLTFVFTFLLYTVLHWIDALEKRETTPEIMFVQVGIIAFFTFYLSYLGLFRPMWK